MKKKIAMMACIIAIVLSSCTIQVEDSYNKDKETVETQVTANDGASDQGEEALIEENDPGALADFTEMLDDMQSKRDYYAEQVRQQGVDDVLYEIGAPVTVAKLETIDDTRVRAILEEILSKGYSIVDQGEYFTVNLDYAYLMEQSRNLTGAVRDYVELYYYNQRFRERLESLTNINMDEYAAMIIRAENHFSKWPESAYKGALNTLYKEELLFYFLGDANYQVFDYNTNKLKAESLELMKKHMKLYEGSEFSSLGVKYLLALEGNDYAYHPEYIQMIDNFRRFGVGSDLTLVENKIMDAKQSIFIPELKGHENMTIQESINTLIRSEVDAVKRETGFTDDSEGVFYFNTYIYFANSQLLSLECIGSHNQKDWTRDASVSKTYTFDLLTGEPLTLERLMGQNTAELDAWLLPVVNAELLKYFGDDSEVETLEDAAYVLQSDAIQIIGKDATHRVYIPKWVLSEHIDIRKIFRE